MATADLQSFIQDRLIAVIPTIDITPGSPADVGIVQPIIAFLGTDPFETDILTFISDRFAQEYPDIFNGNPAAVSDLLAKPLVTFLDPFKRETLSVKKNLSFKDPTLLSDDDADALAANFFETRNAGGFATGLARTFFANPTNVQVEITTQFFTADGLNYFPTNPTSITAEEMVFNRDGALYFIDVPVKAENAGAQYNIDPNTNPLTGVTGLFGVVKVTNTAIFEGGTTPVDTPTFIAQTEQSLTERSLVSRRGATAILSNVFEGAVRAIQVLGAGDPEMQRDILVATSPGHAWLTGQVTLYGHMALVQAATVDDPSITTAPVPGDTLYVYLDKYSNSGAYAALPQPNRFVRLTVEELFVGPAQDTTGPYQVSYLVRWSGSFPTGVVVPNAIALNGGFAKLGTLKISSLPDLGTVNLTVNNQQVHMYGHSDIYVRPVLQTVSTTVLTNIVDDPGTKYFSVELLTLQTTATSNEVSDGTIDFGQAGVQVGDVLTIETGNDAGTYIVGAVSGHNLFLRSNLTTTNVGLRYTIAHAAHVNIFEPKIPKLPFGAVPNNDLQTAIGSNVFNFLNAGTDLVGYGAKIGDTVRILTGADAGDFVITGLVAGGHQITVDHPAGASNSNLTYQVFTKLSPVVLPLVRVKELSLLDSSQQTTGVTVPFANPVAITPVCDFTGAQVRGFSQSNSGYVLPQLVDPDGVSDPFVTGISVAAVSGDRRYSLGFDPTNGGTYKAMLFPNAAEAELLFQLSAFSSCSWFLATSEATNLATNFPPVDPHPGDALTIKTGPNTGGYLIQNVYKFKWFTAGGNAVWIYFIQIYGSFPVDVFRQIIEFCDANGATIPKITNVAPGSTVAFPSFFTGILNGLGANVATGISNIGGTPPATAVIQASILNDVAVQYEWGDPARGTLRSYFNEPTLFQQHTGLNPNPTLYSFKTSGDFIEFRPNPNLYQKQELVPPRLTSDNNPLTYPRDMVPATSIANFTSASRASMFNLGIQVGDFLSIHEEIFFHGSTGVYGTDHETAVGSIAGSTLLSAPATASGNIFDPTMVGNLVFIDEGPDTGAYTVVAVPDDRTLQLSKPLTRTTPTILNQGNNAQWGYDGVHDKIVATGAPGFGAGNIGQYVTIYGMDTRYQGSYMITGTVGGNTLQLSRPVAIGHFPAFPVGTGNANWVITAAPATAPTVNAANLGTQLFGLTPIRMYNEVTADYPVTAVDQSPTTSQVTVTGTMEGGVMEPFRIYRLNLRRVTPSEMALNSFGPFSYFDTEVVSLGDNPAGNLPENSYLTLNAGTAETFGYYHLVDDFTRTYSMKETGALNVQARILPLGLADSEDNFLLLIGTPLQISYERADIVQQFQAFLDSPDDRVTAANLLARHFLPSYVSYDNTYSGGEAPGIIAPDIIAYINNLTVESPIEVSQIEKVIDQDGGDPSTPSTVITLTHDWDRNEWAEFSQGKLGGISTQLPYNGSPRVAYFVPGPDVSGQSPLPTGERINLTQQ